MFGMHASFTSDLFESRTPQPHFINPCCFGEDLAAWLMEKLELPGEPFQEDYGWGFWQKAGNDPYWTCMSVVKQPEGDEPAEWLVSVTYDPGLHLVKRLFHRPQREDLLRICRNLDRILKSEPGIANVQWWLKEPFDGLPRPSPE